MHRGMCPRSVRQPMPTTVTKHESFKIPLIQFLIQRRKCHCCAEAERRAAGRAGHTPADDVGAAAADRDAARAARAAEAERPVCPAPGDLEARGPGARAQRPDQARRAGPRR